MSITSEISRIQTNIADAYTAAEAKGATMPVTENSDSLATTIESITGGGEQVEATNNTGSAITSGDKVWINQENGENSLVNLYNNTPNYTVGGTPTFDSSGKVVSGFSTTSELQLLDRKKYSTGEINSMEIVFKIHTPTEGNWTDSGRIINSRTVNDDFALAISPTYSGFRFLETDSSADIVYVAPANIASDTDYWIKVTYDGTNLRGYYSLDGENYTLQDTSEHPSNNLYLNSLYGYLIGNRHLYSGYNNPVCVWNGSIDLSESYIKINGEVWWQPYETNVTDDTQTGIAAENIAAGSTGLVNVGAVIEPTIQSLNITPSTSVQTFTPSNIDGYGPINVSAVTSSIDANITAGNIKSGVSILGVTGTYTNPKFGINIDNLLGTPVNGVLGTGANTDGDIVFTGVTKLTDFALCAFLINRSNFTHNVSFPDLLSIEGENVLWDAFYKCINIGTVSFPALVNISGDSCFYYAFRACPFTTFTFPELKYIGGTTSVLQYAFYQCTSLTTVSFPKLEEITCPLAFSYCFSNCSSLTDVYFNALTSNSFGSYTNQFSNMLSRCTGVTLHFPSGLQNTISSLSGYPNFGGTDTVVLFDLSITGEEENDSPF